MGNYGSLLLKLRDLTDFKIEECYTENLFNNDVLETNIKSLFEERRVISLNFDSKVNEDPQSIVTYSRLAFRIRN